MADLGHASRMSAPQVSAGHRWRSLSREEKQRRLVDLRRRQQAQIELEVRRLPLGR